MKTIVRISKIQAETPENVLQNTKNEWEKKSFDEGVQKQNILQDSETILENNGQGRRDMREYSAFLRREYYQRSLKADAVLNLDKNHVHIVSFPWSHEWGWDSAGMYVPTNFEQSQYTTVKTLPNGLNTYSFDIKELAEGPLPNGLTVVVCRITHCSPGQLKTNLTPFRFTNVKPGDVYYSRDARALLEKS